MRPLADRRPAPPLLAGLWFAAWLIGLLAAQAQPAPSAMRLHRYESRTQQFVVFGALPGTAFGATALSLLETNHVQIEPTVLVLTCERLKFELLKELNMSDGWTGQIHITVRGDMPPAEVVVVESQWFSNGWRYRMVLPGQMERPRLVRALTRALLLELTNRHNRSQRLAEIPLWLEAGLAAHLLAVHGETLVAENRTRRSSDQGLVADVFRDAHLRLQGHELTAFSDLTLAQPGQFTEEQWEVFRCISQLLVAELLLLPEGRAGLRELLRLLPSYLNPQLAFLRAFEPQFPSMLEVEKWWSAAWLNFTTRDRHLRLSFDASLRQLEEILTTPIAVRVGTNAMPGRKELPLRELIANTEYLRHQPAVAQATLQLQLLQVSAPGELTRLIGDYRQSLLTYLKRRTEFSTSSTSKSADAKIAVKDALQQLDLLDVIREDFQRVSPAAVPAPVVPE